MVIPSIDLMNGKAVQLRQGKEKVLERDDVFALADRFNVFGEIAVIDLDAAMGTRDNREMVKMLLKRADCRVGGGVKTVEGARDLIGSGAHKVIIGSMAFVDGKPNCVFLKELRDRLGPEHIIIALDNHHGEVVTHGWTERTQHRVDKVITEFEPYCGEFLLTCVEREGMLQGIDVPAVERLRSLTDRTMTVAGGIKALDDIALCTRLGCNVQLGMSLYTGTINLVDAFVESLNWNNGLIPTITQDHNGQVLMLAYSNRDSLRCALSQQKMWYFSRSRNRLWMKGETSGNFQELIKVRTDCDGDTLLATVRQHGGACHQGSYSCFGARRFSLNELFEVIQEREINPRPDSYTASLSEERLMLKILEEAQELIQAEKKEDVTWEAADLVYFISVMLACRGVSLTDVIDELRRRRK